MFCQQYDHDDIETLFRSITKEHFRLAMTQAMWKLPSGIGKEKERLVRCLGSDEVSTVLGCSDGQRQCDLEVFDAP